MSTIPKLKEFIDFSKKRSVEYYGNVLINLLPQYKGTNEEKALFKTFLEDENFLEYVRGFFDGKWERFFRAFANLKWENHMGGQIHKDILKDIRSYNEWAVAEDNFILPICANSKDKNPLFALVQMALIANGKMPKSYTSLDAIPQEDLEIVREEFSKIPRNVVDAFMYRASIKLLKKGYREATGVDIDESTPVVSTGYKYDMTGGLSVWLPDIIKETPNGAKEIAKMVKSAQDLGLDIGLDFKYCNSEDSVSLYTNYELLNSYSTSNPVKKLKINIKDSRNNKVKLNHADYCERDRWFDYHFDFKSPLVPYTMHNNFMDGLQSGFLPFMNRYSKELSKELLKVGVIDSKMQRIEAILSATTNNLFNSPNNVVFNNKIIADDVTSPQWGNIIGDKARAVFSSIKANNFKRIIANAKKISEKEYADFTAEYNPFMAIMLGTGFALTPIKEIFGNRFGDEYAKRFPKITQYSFSGKNINSKKTTNVGTMGPYTRAEWEIRDATYKAYIEMLSHLVAMAKDYAQKQAPSGILLDTISAYTDTENYKATCNLPRGEALDKLTFNSLSEYEEFSQYGSEVQKGALCMLPIALQIINEMDGTILEKLTKGCDKNGNNLLHLVARYPILASSGTDKDDVTYRSVFSEVASILSCNFLGKDIFLDKDKPQNDIIKGNIIRNYIQSMPKEMIEKLCTEKNNEGLTPLEVYAKTSTALKIHIADKNGAYIPLFSLDLLEKFVDASPDIVNDGTLVFKVKKDEDENFVVVKEKLREEKLISEMLMYNNSSEEYTARRFAHKQKIAKLPMF